MCHRHQLPLLAGASGCAKHWSFDRVLIYAIRIPASMMTGLPKLYTALLSLYNSVALEVAPPPIYLPWVSCNANCVQVGQGGG